MPFEDSHLPKSNYLWSFLIPDRVGVRLSHYRFGFLLEQGKWNWEVQKSYEASGHSKKNDWIKKIKTYMFSLLYGIQVILLNIFLEFPKARNSQASKQLFLIWFANADTGKLISRLLHSSNVASNSFRLSNIMHLDFIKSILWFFTLDFNCFLVIN